mgnify:CR=1 FL=1
MRKRQETQQQERHAGKYLRSGPACARARLTLAAYAKFAHSVLQS